MTFADYRFAPVNLMNGIIFIDWFACIREFGRMLAETFVPIDEQSEIIARQFRLSRAMQHFMVSGVVL